MEKAEDRQLSLSDSDMNSWRSPKSDICSSECQPHTNNVHLISLLPPSLLFFRLYTLSLFESTFLHVPTPILRPPPTVQAIIVPSLKRGVLLKRWPGQTLQESDTPCKALIVEKFLRGVSAGLREVASWLRTPVLTLLGPSHFLCCSSGTRYIRLPEPLLHHGAGCWAPFSGSDYRNHCRCSFPGASGFRAQGAAAVPRPLYSTARAASSSAPGSVQRGFSPAAVRPPATPPPTGACLKCTRAR
nr:uncharacterized protein LOC121832148 [Peromyscus maniculatus bairdii]